MIITTRTARPAERHGTQPTAQEPGGRVIHMPRRRVAAREAGSEPVVRPQPDVRRRAARRPDAGSRRVHACRTPAAPTLHGSRLTARGRVVVALVWVLLAAVAAIPVVGHVNGGPEADAETVQVRIEPGDTLWGVVREIAPPGADPRPMVDQIVRINHLRDGADIRPGDVIRVPTAPR